MQRITFVWKIRNRSQVTPYRGIDPEFPKCLYLIVGALSPKGKQEIRAAGTGRATQLICQMTHGDYYWDTGNENGKWNLVFMVHQPGLGKI